MSDAWQEVRDTLADSLQRMQQREEDVAQDDLVHHVYLAAEDIPLEEKDYEHCVDDAPLQATLSDTTWLLTKVQASIEALWAQNASLQGSTDDITSFFFCDGLQSSSHGSTTPSLSQRGIARRLKLLDIIYQGVMTKTSRTKRDIYYQDVELFQSQRTVDRLVDEYAAKWAVPRDMLSIVAAPKSYFVGNATLLLSDGAELSGMLTGHVGTLLPSSSQQVHVQSTATNAIFVEKDAAFHHLLQTLTPSELASLVLVTSRGYADHACIRFLQLLAESMPVYAMCDADPHGVQIYMSLKYGTASSYHLPEEGKVHSIQWLNWHDAMRPSSALLPLLVEDVYLALRLLQRLSGVKVADYQVCRLLQDMLHARCKYEINTNAIMQTDDPLSLFSTMLAAPKRLKDVCLEVVMSK